MIVVVCWLALVAQQILMVLQMYHLAINIFQIPLVSYCDDGLSNNKISAISLNVYN